LLSSFCSFRSFSVLACCRFLGRRSFVSILFTIVLVSIRSEFLPGRCSLSVSQFDLLGSSCYSFHSFCLAFRICSLWSFQRLNFLLFVLSFHSFGLSVTHGLRTVSFGCFIHSDSLNFCSVCWNFCRCRLSCPCLPGACARSTYCYPSPWSGPYPFHCRLSKFLDSLVSGLSVRANTFALLP
jgi:hypothetical protein